MKKRYSKPEGKMNKVPSRRKLAAQVGSLVVEVMQHQHLLACQERACQREMNEKSRAQEQVDELRRECQRLQKQVDELVGTAWEQYAQVSVRAYAHECLHAMTVNGGRVRVGVEIDWRPFQRHSRGERADLAWLQAVKRKLLAAAEEQLNAQLMKL